MSLPTMLTDRDVIKVAERVAIKHSHVALTDVVDIVLTTLSEIRSDDLDQARLDAGLQPIPLSLTKETP